jgi:flagellar motility protein MotE (MotC chaperone)
MIFVRMRVFALILTLFMVIMEWTPSVFGSSACLVTESALEDLKKSKEELNKRAQELSQRESELKAREQILTEELKKLKSLRELVSSDQKQRDQMRAERVEKVMSTLNLMSPKSASQLLSKLDGELATEIMFQMNPERLAKLMNLIEPKRASELSEGLAGLARAKDHPDSSASVDAAAAKELEWKGGEKYGNDHKLTAKIGSSSEGPSTGSLESKKP